MNLKHLNKIADSEIPEFRKIELQFDAQDPEGKNWAQYIYAERDLMKEELLDRDSTFAEWCGTMAEVFYYIETNEYADFLPFTDKRALWGQLQIDLKSIVDDPEFLHAEIDLYIDGNGYSLQSDYEELYKLGFLGDQVYQVIDLAISGKNFSELEYDEDDLI